MGTRLPTVPEEHIPEHKTIKTRIESGESAITGMEMERQRKDGSRFFLTASIAPLRDADGNIYAYMSIGMDITERRQTEEALRQSEARYRTLVENQVDLVSQYLPDSTLTFVNDAYCQFFGKTRGELIGQSYLFMIAPEYRDLVRQETADLARNPRPLSGEYLNYRWDGAERWIQWIVRCIADDGGQVVEGDHPDAVDRPQHTQALAAALGHLEARRFMERLGHVQPLAPRDAGFDGFGDERRVDFAIGIRFTSAPVGRLPHDGPFFLLRQTGEAALIRLGPFRRKLRKRIQNGLMNRLIPAAFDHRQKNREGPDRPRGGNIKHIGPLAPHLLQVKVLLLDDFPDPVRSASLKTLRLAR